MAQANIQFALNRCLVFTLPRHLLMRVLAYRLQADRLGNLDAEVQRLLDSPTSPEQI